MQTGDETTYLTQEFRPLRHDLLVAGLHAEIEDVRETSGDPRLLATLRVDGKVIGTLAVDRASVTEDRLRLLADFTQDLVLENVTSSGGSVTWPRCLETAHGHPMTTATGGGRALWVCPAGEGHAVPIGELTGSR
jgi:hypothetical protein